MNTPRTSIRLIELNDAEALAAHLGRDAEAFARWDPERPSEFYTPAGQRSRIESMLMQHHNGEVWPGVVLGDDVVVGQGIGWPAARAASSHAESWRSGSASKSVTATRPVSRP
jgi:RimJ/RimL family protein N-acetyltransferase